MRYSTMMLVVVFTAWCLEYVLLRLGQRVDGSERPEVSRKLLTLGSFHRTIVTTPPRVPCCPRALLSQIGDVA